MKLRIGEISYANLFPVFHLLRENFDCSEYEIVSGVPSELNRMLREGSIDVSPSSSVEYLMRPGMYKFIDGHSISCEGPVMSILLLTRKPLSELDGCRIALTSQSETSVLLLRVILETFHGMRPVYASGEILSVSRIMDRFDACLLIGDAALRELKSGHGFRMHDLGALWNRQTGLPFVFALWLYRQDLPEAKQALVSSLASQIRQTRYLMKFSLPAIARAAPQAAWMTEAGLVSYWETLSYDLEAPHLQALNRFREWIDGLAEIRMESF